MTVELDTSMCPIVVPDTYGIGFQYKVDEDMWEDFKRLMIDKAENYINAALVDTDFAGAKLTMGKFGSPPWYNYETDWIEFTLEFDDAVLDNIKIKADNEFFEYAKKYFGSYDGFISFYPIEREEYFRALNGSGRNDLAIAMLILYEFEKENNLDDYQREYLVDVSEYAFENGYFIDDEEVSE